MIARVDVTVTLSREFGSQSVATQDCEFSNWDALAEVQEFSEPVSGTYFYLMSFCISDFGEPSSHGEN